jgi:hypothetical protein
MHSHRSLQHVPVRASGLARIAHGKHAAAPARTRKARGIIVLAVASGSLGVVAAASSAHGIAGPAAPHHPASGTTAATTLSISPSIAISNRPWMY